MSVIKKAYISYITCKICGKEMNTGICHTRLGVWIKIQMIKRKHWHTKAEVLGKQMFGIYIPTTDRKKRCIIHNSKIGGNVMKVSRSELFIVNKLVFKIKGILGFCQCKKCWNRSVATIAIKQIGKSIDICEKHMDKTLEDAKLTGITFRE